MVIPRSWSPAEKQRDYDQQNNYARPMATDMRFKAAAFILFASWLVIVFSLWHSIKHYRSRNGGAFDRILGDIRFTPVRFVLTLTLALVLVGYATASAFNFDIGIIKVQIEGEPSNVPWLYGLGWAPIALIMIVQEVSGYLLPNEDRELIRQRRLRGVAIDREIGIVKKPHWWSRLHGDHDLNMHDAIARNVKEVGGGHVTARNLEKAIEMGNMPASRAFIIQEGTPDVVKAGASLLFPASLMVSDMPNVGATRASDLEGRSRTYDGSLGSTLDRSSSAQSSNIFSVAPQKVRSMLDV